MNFTERFKLFALGLIGGIFLVVLFFGNRNSCKNSVSHYLPEGRVIQEILFKDIRFSDSVKQQLKTLDIRPSTFKDRFIENADVDFELSDQRAKPCGQYVLFGSDSIQNLKIELEKCREYVLIKNIVASQKP